MSAYIFGAWIGAGFGYVIGLWHGVAASRREASREDRRDVLTRRMADEAQRQREASRRAHPSSQAPARRCRR